MNPLAILTSCERAVLLHQLFPDHIEHFIAYALKRIERYEKFAYYQAQDWNNNLFTFEEWMALSESIKAKLLQQKMQLLQSANWFGQELFTGLIDYWMQDALINYVRWDECIHQPFGVMIKLLFPGTNPKAA